MTLPYQYFFAFEVIVLPTGILFMNFFASKNTAKNTNFNICVFVNKKSWGKQTAILIKWRQKNIFFCRPKNQFRFI